MRTSTIATAAAALAALAAAGAAQAGPRHPRPGDLPALRAEACAQVAALARRHPGGPAAAAFAAHCRLPQG